MMCMYDEDQKLIHFLIKTSLRKHNTPCYGQGRIQFFSLFFSCHLIYLLCLSQNFTFSQSHLVNDFLMGFTDNSNNNK